MIERSPSPSAVPCSVQPRVETSWLALPLSARGLVDELAKYADQNGRVILGLDDGALDDDGAEASAVGKEIARLLCAHPGELARIRRDTKTLLDHRILLVDRSAIRLECVANESASPLERRLPMTDAERAQRCRDRRRTEQAAALEPSRNVTTARDESRDDRHAASGTRSLSFKEGLDPKSLKERERFTPIVTAQRDAASEAINEVRRAKAKQLGLEDHRIHLVWAGFLAKHAEQKKTELEWDNRWAWWVTNQLLLETRAQSPAKLSVKRADLEAPWIRDAMGDP